MKTNKRTPKDAPSPDSNASRKVIKVDHDGDNPDYSSDVRKKIQGSNRTGQACDRCRVRSALSLSRPLLTEQMRKMRCDGSLDGCAPCVQTQTPCKTTDRITGIANERGYVKRLEQRIKNLEKHIRRLEDRLTSVGEDVKPFELSSDPPVALLQWKDPTEQLSHQQWDPVAAGPEQYAPQDHPVVDNVCDRLPEFRSGLTGDNYLGVSSGNSFISSIRGTAMNVLGAEIDLADYMSPDLDEPERPLFGHEYPLNKSYHAFVRTAYSGNPKAQKVPLPPQDEGIMYSEWYFRMVNPYMPILHKPTFLSMVSKSAKAFSSPMLIV